MQPFYKTLIVIGVVALSVSACNADISNGKSVLTSDKKLAYDISNLFRGFTHTGLHFYVDSSTGCEYIGVDLGRNSGTWGPRYDKDGSVMGCGQTVENIVDNVK